MLYQNELSFLTEIFERNGIYARALSSEEAERLFKDEREEIHFSPSDIREGVLYKLKDRLDCHFRILSLPDSDGKFLTVGPFLCEKITDSGALEIAERCGMSLKEGKYLSEYYSSLTVLGEGAHLLVMLGIFCEKIWKTSNYAVSEINGEEQNPKQPFSKTALDSRGDSSIDIKAMERRYEYENRMIRAVELGLSQTDIPFTVGEVGDFFENRASDPIRNYKNYGIIMNTLLRKAAERGGVHPIYLDGISSDFAVRLERAEKVSEISSIMQEMFRSYCRLVRKHRLNGYSLTVQKIILTIDADLSANLTASSLAKKHGISLGYLSSAFRRETGKTVSEYIAERRIEYAKYLLSSTRLQVQSVALHTGIMDVQYFSKIFKKHVGQTPSEYRNNLKNGNNYLQK